MTKKEMVRLTHHKLAGGVVHKLPADLREAFVSAGLARAIWEDITPLARNEWICWVTSGKKVETRSIRIKKAISKLKSGMRRPCCWVGCPLAPNNCGRGNNIFARLAGSVSNIRLDESSRGFGDDDEGNQIFVGSSLIYPTAGGKIV